jgi:hypothetical protein
MAAGAIKLNTWGCGETERPAAHANQLRPWMRLSLLGVVRRTLGARAWGAYARFSAADTKRNKEPFSAVDGSSPYQWVQKPIRVASAARLRASHVATWPRRVMFVPS